MSLLRSKQELLAQYDEISEYVHQHNEPVYITDAEGRSDTVLLSAETYNQLTSNFTLNQLLNSAALGEAPGEKFPEVDVLAELEKLK